MSATRASLEQVDRSQLSICVLDDDTHVVDLTAEWLATAGFTVFPTTDPSVALNSVEAGGVHLVLSDIQMPLMHGFDVLEKVLHANSATYVVFMTGNYSIDSAIAAIKRGAYDYLPKPIDYRKLTLTLDEVAALRERQRELEELEEKVATNVDFQEIVGQSAALREVFDLVRKISKHYNNVLLTGPTGSGKELFARALHRLSPVASQPFVACNCSALVDTLLESQLFGHVRGAFTGAFDSRPGLFEFANGGTIFLDEIGETSLQMQAKLLRVIQNREIQRVGSPATTKIDVRVIAATNRDLRSEVSAGRFREDLFYRVTPIEVRIPGLQSRITDIPLLARHFIRRCNQEYGKALKGLTSRAETALLQHSWPGNVRELENVISGAAITAAGDSIDLGDLPDHLRQPKKIVSGAEAWQPLTLGEVERLHIRRVLEVCEGNQLKAAALLGISRTSLYRHLKRVPDL